MVTTPRGRIPIRSTSTGVQRLLADALPHDPGPVESLPQGLGLRPAEDDGSFHWLYWGRCPVVRTRDADRLLTALEQHLSAPGVSGADQLILRLSAGVTAAGEAFLLPSLGADVAKVDRQLREAGAALIDAPLAVVDPHTGELVIEEPSMTLLRDSRRKLAEELRTVRSEPTVAPGRYPLTQWVAKATEPEATDDPMVLLALLATPTTERGIGHLFRLASRLRHVVTGVQDVRSVVGHLRLSS